MREETAIACAACGSTREHVEMNMLIAGLWDSVCCDLGPAANEPEPEARRVYSDTERLDKLEALLRERDEIQDLWFDPDGEIVWAGVAPGDTLRQALDDLLDGRI